MNPKEYCSVRRRERGCFKGSLSNDFSFQDITQKNNCLCPFPPPSAYTEAYKVCLLAAAPQAASGDVRGETAGEEDAGRTSDEEEGGAERNYEGQVRNLGVPVCH